MAAGAGTGEHETTRRDERARGAVLFAVLLTLMFACLAARLVQLQVMEHERLAVEAARQVYGVVRDRERRGFITDSRGVVLASSVEVKACAIDPKTLLEAEGARPERLLSTLAEMLSLTPGDMQRINEGMEKRRRVSGGDGEREEPVRFVWVKRRLDDAEWNTLSRAMAAARREASDAWRYRRRWLKIAGERKVAGSREGMEQAREAAEGWRKIALAAEGRFAGVFFPPEYERVYPQGRLASHILGFSDIDGRGLEGVEKTCEALLQGVSRERLVARDARSRPLSALAGAGRSTDGMTVELTVDAVVQAIVEEELQRGVDRLKPQCPEITAHAVVMDPFSGDILAIANYPSFDPNRPADAEGGHRVNNVVSSVQEPGSTFKPLLIAAALDEKAANLEETIDCATFRMENGRTIKDIHPYGRMSLRMALVKSSNPAMVRVGLKLGPEKMREYVLRYGFGERTESMLPGESRGRVTGADKWSSYTMGSVPMGYEVAVTSLQMAAAYSVIANGGLLPRPNIVRAVYDSQGGLAVKREPVMRRRVISEATAAAMRSVLRSVVTEGTGRRANIKEFPLGGKTGTANMIANDKERAAGQRGYSRNRHTANFVALAPWDKPRAVIVVSIRETSKYGGEASSPVGAAIARRLLGYLGVPTETGQPVKAETAPLEAFEPKPAPAAYTVGEADDENALSEEVDPRIWTEWIEDEEAVG